jgi:intracellular sulfur oxidation DsrE/DsrF family protein
MRQTLLRIAATAALLLPAPALAQSGEALIREIGGTPRITDPTFAAPKDLIYKMAWHVTEAPEKAGDIAPGFRSPAAFYRLMDANGVARTNVKLAVIVHGTATPSLLNNAAYKARTGSDNGSIALLTALHEAGVQIIVCGHALGNRNVARDQLLPFVTVATTATSAHAILHAQGYEVLSP